MLFQLLGIPANSQISDAVVQKLVEGRQTETQHIEFKREYPAQEGKAHREFARDVSSFANSRGGLIVFGIACEGDRASQLTPVELGPRATSLVQTLSSLCFPRIPGLRVHEVDDARTGKGVLILEVPPSPIAPHLVQEGSGFSCWRRVERGKVPLHEAELERAYRLRGESELRVEERLRNVRDKWLPDFSQGSFWIEFVPITSARRAVALTEAKRFLAELSHTPAIRGFYAETEPFGDTRIRFRRVEATASWGADRSLWPGVTVLHDDGTLFQVRRGWPTNRNPRWRPEFAEGNPTYVSAGFLAQYLLVGLVLYRECLRRTDVSGTALVAAGLTMRPKNMAYFVSEFQDMQTISEDVQVTTQIDLESLNDGKSVVDLAAEMLADLSSTFGRPTNASLFRDGALCTERFRALCGNVDVRPWAATVGLPTVD